MLGVFVSVALLVVLALMDNTIHDEDYILNNYGYPILAKIPDLVNTSTKKYAYYSHYKKQN